MSVECFDLEAIYFSTRVYKRVYELCLKQLLEVFEDQMRLYRFSIGERSYIELCLSHVAAGTPYLAGYVSCRSVPGTCFSQQKYVNTEVPGTDPQDI